MTPRVWGSRGLLPWGGSVWTSLFLRDKGPDLLGGVRAPAQLCNLSLLTSPLCAWSSTKELDNPRLFVALPDLWEPREGAKRPETGNVSN